jgi:hypothetical protein
MSVPYASVVRSNMCIQVQTRPTIGIISKYIISPEMDHWKSHRKVLHFMQDNKVNMLTNKKIWYLNIVGI